MLAQFGSGSRIMLSVLRKNIKNNFKEKQFSPKNIPVPVFFKIDKKIMSPEEILFNWVSKLWIYVLNLTYTFCLYFFLYLHMWILKLLNTHPIHNTACGSHWECPIFLCNLIRIFRIWPSFLKTNFASDQMSFSREKLLKQSSYGQHCLAGADFFLRKVA